MTDYAQWEEKGNYAGGPREAYVVRWGDVQRSSSPMVVVGGFVFFDSGGRIK